MLCNVDGVQPPSNFGCSYASHRDIRVRFTILESCEQRVWVQVRNIKDKANWCYYDGAVHVVTKSSTGADLVFPETGDRVGSCTIRELGEQDDGLHINPCGDGPYIMFRVGYGETEPDEADWTGWQGWGDTTVVPLPSGQVQNVQVSRSGGSLNVTWDPEPAVSQYLIELQRRNQSSCDSGGWSSVSAPNPVTGTATTISGIDSNNAYRVRVRAFLGECENSSTTPQFSERVCSPGS